MAPILSGVRIIDLTMGYAGPLATSLLASMGAEIVKIESLQVPDWWRGRHGWTGPEDMGYEQSFQYNSVNRNKLGITLNLRHPYGVEAFKRLAAISDVVIENYSPRVMTNFGLGYDTLRELRPDIVMVSMPAFGRDGPWKDYIGFGQTMEAASGLTHFNGYEGGQPLLLPNGADPFVGLNGANAVMLALIHRADTGSGQFVEVAHMEAVTPFVGERLLSWQMGNKGPVNRKGNRSDWMAPHGCYRSKGEDQWVVIAVASDEEWDRFCELPGDPAFKMDERFRTARGRLAHKQELDALIEAWTQERDRDELVSSLQGVGIAAGMALSDKDLTKDPHLRETGYFHSLERRYAGVHEYPRAPIRLSRSPQQEPTAAPTLGQYNEYVLSDILGFTKNELQEMRTDKVIGERLSDA